MNDDLRSLECLRETGKHDPDLVLRLGRERVKTISGQGAYSLLEQVAIAAIECRDRPTTTYCLERLKKRFDSEKSPRLMLLLGLEAESFERWKDAEDIYRKILKLNALHRPSIKRLAQIAVQQNDLSEAINILTEYLDQVYDDAEAWRECSTIYSRLGLRSQAIFASEEVLLLQPKMAYNFLYHAELLYGSDEHTRDLNLAFKTFLHCAEQGLEIPRVWLGILLCSKRLRVKSPASQKLERIELSAKVKLQSQFGADTQSEVMNEWLASIVQ